MEVINNIQAVGAEEISHIVENALSSIKNTGYIDNPLIFVEKYIKTENGSLETVQMYGLLKIPVYLLHDACDEGDTVIHIPLRHNKLHLKIGAENWKETESELVIPFGASLIEVKGQLERGTYENISQIEKIKSEHVFKLYVGDVAYNKVAESANSSKLIPR
jgi:hypothetical protein